MDVEIRNPESRDIDAIEKLLNESFQYGDGESYRIDFAPLFSKEALQTSRVVIGDGGLIASGALHVAKVASIQTTYTAGIIGAIATNSKHRNAGFASKIIQELEAVARTQGCNFLVLWSDQVEFYEKLGFTPAGAQEVYLAAEIFQTIDQSMLIKIFESVPGNAAYGWNDEVRNMYQKHRLRCVRTENYWREIEKIRSCTRLQWLGLDGIAKAYLGFNRGKDLKGVIHEWGGEPNALVKLIAAAITKNPELTWLTHPNIEDPFLKLAKNNVGPIMKSHLALFKTLSTKKIDYSNIWFWGLDSL